MRIDDDFEARTASRKRSAGSRSRSAASSRSGSGSGRSSSGSSSSRTSSGRSSSTRSGSGRTSSTRRTSSARSGRSGRNKRRSSFDITTLLMIIAGILVAVIIGSIAYKSVSSIKPKDKTTEEETTIEEETTAEDALTNSLSVMGVDITGLTQEAAREAILDNCKWSMKATYGDKEAPIENILYAPVDELLDIIYAGDLEEGKEYDINLDSIEVAAQAQASEIAAQWNMTPKSGGLTGYDEITGKFTFGQGEKGIAIDQDKLAEDIVKAVKTKKYDAIIEATTKEVNNDASVDEIQSKYTTIGYYETTTTSNSNRNTNIKLAVKALNGTILNPGQEFSFNNTTGVRSEAKGYKAAPAYLNGEVVQEPGGGVCQVSSTLYNAVVFAGLRSTERHAHTFEPSYVTPGEDAAVSFGGPDFRFVNSSNYPIAIKASFEEGSRKLAVSIYGIPVLEEGVKIRMSSKKVSQIDPPAPTIEEDGTIEPGTDVVAKEGTPGSSWATDIVTYKDGNEVKREFFHNSAYKGKPGIVKRNTSGSLASTENAEGASVADPNAPGETLPLAPGSGPSPDGKPVVTPDSGNGPAAGPGPMGETESKPVYVAPGETAAPSTTEAATLPPIENNPVAPGPMAPGENAPSGNQSAPGAPGQLEMVNTGEGPGA